MSYSFPFIPFRLLKCVPVLLHLYTCSFLDAFDIDVVKRDYATVESNLERLQESANISLSNLMHVNNALCLGKWQLYTLTILADKSILLPNNKVDGLVGYWTFDRLHPIDESGNGNHINTQVTYGPPSNGHGSSLLFGSDTSYNIKASKSLDLGSFTLAFWIYLTGDYSSHFRMLISRNGHTSQSPTILLYPYDNRLSVRVETTVGNVEGLSSNSSIPQRRWTHISVVAKEDSLKLYVNGMLDNSIGLNGKLVKSSGDITLGRKFKHPGLKGYMDELRIYNYPMGTHEIASFASNSLTGFDSPYRVQLGSTSCEYKDANANGFCPSGYKICSLDQLYISGAHIARVNGWMHSSNQIWHKDLTNIDDTYRVALCCS
ncbi:hypothetical protein BEWA_032050 [Theileria equi strain WA]|uniref:LamG-like jellyroll fold domain-containing protein n=1 Tax=Theileria equi strain WA TaxID=1537102 RepID=L0AXQ8_THEEQ|nr:hypothetical protein BEWA_032050 [Theileria equi strain WA]AFZ80352.1 hypothetical protein BEWA_032050 [Theileria equi strain WA]|eukprot:XP_004830018.1 hypothetical protein BEWA_032050 [Theileria equi strain WA]